MPSARLHVRIDGREAVLGPALGEVGVGSGRRCLVRLPESDGVATLHATLVPGDDGWSVASADPSCAVWCDGRPIASVDVDRPLLLRLGDPLTGPSFEVAPADDDAISTATGEWDEAALGTPAHTPGTVSHELSGDLVLIGRDPASDVVVADVQASRRHAELRRTAGGTWELVDAGSHNGTFLNGRRVDRAPIAEHDVVMVGRHSFRLLGGRLEEEVDSGEVAYAAKDVTVALPDGKVLVNGVTFSVGPRTLLAVVGPSGAGKSTLMRVLTGQRVPTSGDVLYDGRSVIADYDALRRRIGFVPQDDIVHPELPVRRALEFAADLRFAADVAPDERRARVDEVLEELDLGRVADLRVASLSGGQRKRVSVALELLTQPSLLFLDEPTSGLDPNYERSLMKLFRGLADGGRTVVVVTHATESLRLCDRVLVLAPGGGVAYFGPPQLITAYFGCEDLPDVFGALTRERDAGWPERFRAHPLHERFVERTAAPTPPPRPDAGERAVRPRIAATTWLRQLRTLTRRYAEVVLGDRRNVALLALQAPLLGVLMLVALPAGELGPADDGELRLISQASLVLLVLVLGVTWLGMSNAVREIAKELPIVDRERAVGLSVSAYVLSKAAVLGAVTAVQAVVLILLAAALQDGPQDGVLFGWPLGEVLVIGALGGIAAMALGLLVSVLARTEDRATTILPIVLVFQLVLALGGVFPDIGDKPVLKQLGYTATTQWTFAGMASTADLNDLNEVTGVLTRTPSVNVEDPSTLFDELERGDRGEPRWDHDATTWLLDATALLVLTALALLAAALALSRERRS